MATLFQVNLQIGAGVPFNQQFFLKNPDGSSVNITNFNFYAAMAKHPDAINAVTTTSTSTVLKAIQFTTVIDDAVNGAYSLSLPAETTAKLEEGKYVYSIVVADINGDKSEIVKGLVFVTPSFGDITILGTLDPDYP